MPREMGNLILLGLSLYILHTLEYTIRFRGAPARTLSLLINTVKYNMIRFFIQK